MSLTTRTVKFAWAAIAVVFASVLLIAAVGHRGARTLDEQVLGVAATIKCPTCVGQSVAQSEAPASRDIRVDIARRLSLGESDDQIRQDMADRFGPDILLSPSHRGVVGLVWILPVLMAVLVLIGLTVAFRRWHRLQWGEISEADRLLVDKALATLKISNSDDEDDEPQL